MTPLLLVGASLAGGAGAAARFVVDGLVRSRSRRVPWLGTLTVNVAGTLLLGVVAGLAAAAGGGANSPAHLLAVLVGTGFCGGFTTMSTANVEVARLARDGRSREARIALASMLALCLVAATAGLAAGTAVGAALR